MKSPKQLRQEIQELSKHLLQVQHAISQKADIKIAKIGRDCKKTAEDLAEMLQKHHLPDDYKVAVVGRFKAGKSSFVNELLERKLAGENTSPETAAITSFYHGDIVLAKIHFIGQAEWEKLNVLYDEDPKHPDAYRIKKWMSFSHPQETKASQVSDVFDLTFLRQQYLHSEEHEVRIELDPVGGKEAEKKFRAELKKFTSGSRPEHCLVQSIDISAPAKILAEGVRLIDTPGLDDTERFRVSLTEKTVEDVDAVLFLTPSGAAYGQSDKDFLLSLLRKGTIKQLIVVITKLDVTYEQHRRAAEDNDEEPDSIAAFIEKEQARIRHEIASTLNELGEADTTAINIYLEQLGEVDIVSTSVTLHRDWQSGRSTGAGIATGDPGGIGQMKEQLLRLLSTESRLALTAQNIAKGGCNILLELQAELEAKLATTRITKDKEVAERKLHTFRDEFGKVSKNFDENVQKQVNRLERRLQEKAREHERDLIENIVLRAREQLSNLETLDVGKHWKTRRSGYWGFMQEFQKRVANQIFPKVHEMLSDYTKIFSDFNRDFGVYMDQLSLDSKCIADHIELGTNLPFTLDVATKLKKRLQKSQENAEKWIAGEEQRIIAMLDDFVSDDIDEQIAAARSKVGAIRGAGTTHGQAAEVRDFYKKVKTILAEALSDHLKRTGKIFSEFLIKAAKVAPGDAIEDIQVELQNAEENILSAAEMQLAGQRELVVKNVEEIHTQIQPTLEMAKELNPDRLSEPEEKNYPVRLEVETTSPVLAVDPPISDKGQVEPEDENWVARVRRDASILVERFHLRDGATGWPLQRILDERFLVSAQSITLIDPHLSAPHQLRNLKELLLHVAEKLPGTLKRVRVETGFPQAGNQERVLQEAAKDLLQNYAVALEVHHATGLHDRFLTLDNGLLFKLGRGLDIYKPAIGLAAHRSASRRVRETEIDVLATPQSATRIMKMGSP